MSDTTKAVFLSYASQDAEAAKRIADALRAAGVEVWFDAEGGLEHGDEWDAKIRRQIKECVLFLPIISANTQAREEGYFRLEWDLAAERARTIASGVAFILPVMIDDTKEPVALVPDRFRTVQWTRLPGGNVPADVLQRFLKLWSHRTGLLKHAENVGRDLRIPPATNEAGFGDPALQKTRPRWLAPMIVGLVVAVIALLVGQPWRKPAPGPAESVKPAASLSDARQLTAKVLEQLNKPELARAELETADGFGRRATELDPNDADAWAASSQVDSWTVYHNFDASAARREAARSKATRAIQLAPAAYEPRLAQACYLVRGQAGGDATLANYAREAEKLLRTLLREKPDEPRALLALGILLRNTGRFPECREAFNRMARQPAFAAQAWNELGWAEYFFGDYTAAGLAIDRSTAVQGYWGNLALKKILAQWWLGDLDLAKAAQDQMPAAARQEDIGIDGAIELAYWRREPETMLQILSGVPRDWLQSNGYAGPTAYFSALAHQLAGREAAAQVQWRTALAVVDRRLAAQPDSGFLLHWKATLLAEAGDRTAAEPFLKLAHEIGGTRSTARDEARLQALLGHADDALDLLEKETELRGRRATAAAYRLNPALDSLRTNPRFQALLARMEADPRFSPQARSPEMAAKSQTLNPGLPNPPPADPKSVAVLAFANLSDDKANEYFSDGISEELLNVLAKIPGLKVTARTSSFHFKGKDTPIPEIAHQLGVAYVIEGSVRKAGDKVRITAQLIKAADGFHVWSDTFTRDLKDIFAVQDEIAGLIAKNLEIKMGIAAARPTVDLDAYQEYLAGRAAVAQAGNANLREAVGHFEKAVAIEPKFAAAWVQLASAHTQLGRWGGAPTRQAWAAARAAIDRAKALEPDSPEVLLALGWILRTAEWDWHGAERTFRRALQLRPNHPESLAGAAVLLYNIGQDVEAFRLGELATRLDPLNAGTQLDLSIMFYLSQRFPEAERTARRALALAPGGEGFHSILGWSLMGQRRYEEAVAEANLDSDEVQRASILGLVAVAKGQEAAARAQVAQMEELARTDPDRADLQLTIAWISAGLGERDRAFAALDKARASRDPSMSWLRNGPQLAPLYSDPRWPALLHQVGLADNQLK